MSSHEYATACRKKWGRLRAFTRARSCVLFRAMDRYELAWAAGFFDGEGWANTVRQRGRSTGQPHAQINQAGSDGVPEVLVRFQKAVGGLGHLGGPYTASGRRPIYRWIASSRDDVEVLHHLLLPWLGAVKSTALANALERMSPPSRDVTCASDEWRAWAAGLFDGEGSICLLDHRSRANYRIGEICVTQSSLAATPEVLHRLLVITGMGHINGPYAQPGARGSIYRWKVTTQSEITPTMSVLLPWLGHVKKAQTTLVLDVLRSQPPLLRGNPAWGNRKTHCVRGHEYATARLRPFVARGGGEQPRDNEQCLQCAREQARARRAEKGSAAKDGGRSIADRAVTYSYYLLK